MQTECTSALRTQRMPTTRNEEYRFTDVGPLLQIQPQASLCPPGIALPRSAMQKEQVAVPATALASQVKLTIRDEVDSVLQGKELRRQRGLPSGFHICLSTFRSGCCKYCTPGRCSGVVLLSGPAGVLLGGRPGRALTGQPPSGYTLVQIASPVDVDAKAVAALSEAHSIKEAAAKIVVIDGVVSDQLSSTEGLPHQAFVGSLREAPVDLMAQYLVGNASG